MAHLAPDPHFSLKRIAIPAFGPSLLYGVSNGAILPVIALSARELGASVAMAGLVTALVGIGSLVSNIPAGWLAARYGERRALTLAAIFSSLALLLCALSPRLGVLALGVFMVGMATAVFLLARQAYLADIVPVHLRARAMSTLGGATRIGVFIGPFLGAAAIHLLGLSGAYWVALAAMVGAGLIAHLAPDVTAPAANTGPAPGHLPQASPARVTTRDVLRSHLRVFLTLGVGVLLVGALRSSRQIVIPLWAEHLTISPTVTALIYGLVSAIDMAMFYPAGKVMDHYGRLWVVVPSTLLMGLSLLFLPLTTTPLAFILVALVLGFGNGIGSGIIMTLAADAAPREGRNAFLGVWRLMSDIGNSGGPALLAAIAGLVSLAAGISLIGACGVLATVVFWRSLPRGPVRH